MLTETKKKGNGVEILRPYLHFYCGVLKEKRAKRGVSILVKKRYMTTWEAINENNNNNNKVWKIIGDDPALYCSM